MTALMWATLHGHDEVIKTILKEAKTDVNLADETGYAALMCATLYGHDEVVKTLLKEGKTDVDLADWDGMTALMFARNEGHDAIVSALIEGKANANLDKDWLLWWLIDFWR